MQTSGFSFFREATDVDKTVPLAQPIAFAAKLHEAGVPVRLITRDGVPHSLVAGEKIDASYTASLLSWLEHVTTATDSSGPSVR